MGTAEELTADLHTMPDHRAVTVFTPRRYRLNRTLETIARVSMTLLTPHPAILLITMCGRYRLTRADQLAERFNLAPIEEPRPRYNVAPGQNIAVIRQHEDRPKRFATSMRWRSAPA